MKLHNILEKNLKIWIDSPNGELCKKFAFYLQSIPIEELEMLTFDSIAKICDKQLPKNLDSILWIVNVFTQEKLLEKRFLFIDLYEDEYDINFDKVNKSISDNYFCHPRTGEPVKDFKNYLYPYFCATNELRKIKCQLV